MILIILLSLTPVTKSFRFFIPNGLSQIEQEGHTQQFSLVFRPQTKNKTLEDLLQINKVLNKINLKKFKLQQLQYTSNLLQDTTDMVANMISRLLIWNNMFKESIFEETTIDTDCEIIISPPISDIDDTLNSLQRLLAVGLAIVTKPTFKAEAQQYKDPLYDINNVALSAKQIVYQLFTYINVFFEDSLYTLNNQQLTPHLFSTIVTSDHTCTGNETYKFKNEIDVLTCTFLNNDLVCKVAFQQTTKFHQHIELISIPYHNKQLCDEFYGAINVDKYPHRDTFDETLDIIYQYQSDQYIGNSENETNDCLKAITNKEECDVIEYCDWCTNNDDFIETSNQHIILIDTSNITINIEGKQDNLENIQLPSLITYNGTIISSTDQYELNIKRDDKYTIESSELDLNYLLECFNSKNNYNDVQSFIQRHQIAITFAFTCAIIITCLTALFKKSGKKFYHYVTKDKPLENWKKQRNNKEQQPIYRGNKNYKSRNT